MAKILINVSTHSGDEDILEVESFIAEEIAEQINDNEIQSIALGGNVYSRIDIRNIKRLDNAADEEGTDADESFEN